MAEANPSITVDQVEFSWDLEKGLALCWGQPVVTMWIESTMAGFMVGLQRMVGTERFNLAMEGAGRESTENEWNNIVMRMPTVEEGLRFIGRAMRVVGLGEVEPVELDREARRLRFRARHSWEGIYQRALGVSWGTWSLAGKLAAYGERMLGVPCQIEQTLFIARGDEYDEFVITPASRTYDDRLRAVVEGEAATRQDLQDALGRLRDEVRERQSVEARLRDEIAERQEVEARMRAEIGERERVEAELRGKLDVIERQKRAIHELSTPILQVWPGIVALPVIGAVDQERVSRMMEGVLGRIVQTRARVVILDLTGAEAIDGAATANLLRIAGAARLLGADCLLSGISPEMSSTLVELGAEFHRISAHSTLETALQEAIRRLK